MDIEFILVDPSDLYKQTMLLYEYYTFIAQKGKRITTSLRPERIDQVNHTNRKYQLKQLEVLQTVIENFGEIMLTID